MYLGGLSRRENLKPLKKNKISSGRSVDEEEKEPKTGVPAHFNIKQ